MVISMSFVSNMCPIKIETKLYYAHAKELSFKFQLLKAARSGYSIQENEVNKLNNLKYARKENGQITIQEIFKNHWSEFVNIQKAKGKSIRQSILKNVEKMIHCKDLSLGYLFFECPKCNNFHIQGLSCHSRFCVSCGKKYRDARAFNIMKRCISVPHRHITWTISEDLRWLFQKYKDLYIELFSSVDDVLKYLIWNKSKASRKRNERLGYISSLHTFGRDMKHNPHIHTLVTECTIDNTKKRKPYSYFNYETLRKAFMNQLLKRMYRFLKRNKHCKDLIKFNDIRKNLYNTKDNGFYVNAPQKEVKNKNQIKQIVNYVCRYQAHPAMSESRIISYDKDKGMVYYYYDPHEDDAILNDSDKIGRQYVTESVYEFIAKLIIHIPLDNIHLTRYYGFYANHSSLDISNQYKLFSFYDLHKVKSNLNWRTRLLSSYHYDPLICSCGAIMKIVPSHCYFLRIP